MPATGCEARRKPRKRRGVLSWSRYAPSHFAKKAPALTFDTPRGRRGTRKAASRAAGRKRRDPSRICTDHDGAGQGRQHRQRHEELDLALRDREQGRRELDVPVGLRVRPQREGGRARALGVGRGQGTFAYAETKKQNSTPTRGLAAGPPLPLHASMPPLLPPSKRSPSTAPCRHGAGLFARPAVPRHQLCALLCFACR